MSRSEAGWQRHEDADYPGRYLTPISVDMVYSYLSCSGFRLFCLFAHDESLVIARWEQHRWRAAVSTTDFELRSRAVAIRVFTIFQLTI